MQGSKALITLAVAGMILAGCNEPVGVRARLPRAGVLQLMGYEGKTTAYRDHALRWSVDPGTDVLVPGQVLVAPDTVAAGQTFDVSVTTIGLSGCWRAAGQDVTTRDRVVELTPSDVHSGADVCTEIVLELTHTSPIAIALPGEWVVRASGRRVRHGDHSWEEPVAAEKTVVVH